MDAGALNIFAAIIGIVMGFLFGLAGFTDSGKTDDLSKNQRVKNFIWLLGGAFSIFLVDWKLASPTPVNPAVRGHLLICYGLGALAAIVVTIGVVMMLIALTVSNRARRQPQFQRQAPELILEYLQFGYRFYRARFDKLEAQSADLVGSAKPLSELGRIVATLLAATALERGRNDPALRETTIDRVLESMENAVKLFAANVDNLQLQTNYMVRVAHDKLGAASPLFVDGDLAAYEGFLVVRRYRDGRQSGVCLPFESVSRVRRALPGAPIAVTERKAVLLNVKKLVFATSVTTVTQTLVKDFFKNAPYVSVLSVPLIWDRKVVGVVNVESSHIDVVDLGSDMVERIADALAPFSMMLGELVHRAEE